MSNFQSYLAQILAKSNYKNIFFNLFKTYYMRKPNKTETVVLKKGKKDIHLDYAELRKAVLVLRAVNHKLRQRVIDLLEENERMTVTEIYIKLRLEQSVASQHLAILRKAGVVATDRYGKFIYYTLDKDRLNQISRLVEELAI
jgi:DNA-binding transcriptional ArsR family regulator